MDKCVVCNQEKKEDDLDYIPHIGKLEEGTGVVLQVPICKNCQQEQGITTIKLNEKGLHQIHLSKKAYDLLEKLDSKGKL